MTSDVGIAVAAVKAGFRGVDATFAVAIALAESGGRETVQTKEPDGSTSFGLWQINSVHTDLLKTGDWRKPEDNAKMARSLFVANKGWKDWSTYNHGQYKMFLPRAQVAVVAAGVIDPFQTIPDIIPTPSADAIPGVAEAKQLASFITDKSNWIRLGYIVIGGLLVWLVIIAMIKQSGLVKGATKVAKAVV